MCVEAELDVLNHNVYFLQYANTISIIILKVQNYYYYFKSLLQSLDVQRYIDRQLYACICVLNIKLYEFFVDCRCVAEKSYSYDIVEEEDCSENKCEVEIRNLWAVNYKL